MKATGKRTKYILLAAVVVVAALTLMAATQQWISLIVDTGGAPTALDVGGQKAAPALSALSLSSFALAGALSIASRFLRAVLGTLQVLLGLCIGWSALGVLTDPISFASPVISDHTGVGGDSSVRALVSSYSVSFWPTAALILGIVAAVLGFAIIFTQRRWPNSGAKYSAVRFESADAAASAKGDAPAARSAGDDWDQLTKGTDPTK
jgi:hypothetical protein